MDPALQLHLGQQHLTPAQKAEARRFAALRIQAQLSTAPVDEQETEALLCQAYQAAGLAAPQHIQWLESPLQLEELLPGRREASINLRLGHSVRASVNASLGHCVRRGVRQTVGDIVGRTVRERVRRHVWERVQHTIMNAYMTHSVWYSACACYDADWLAVFHFLHVSLAPNALHALAHFNERVSGYWLGKDAAVVVRRPRMLSRDTEGRLHSTRGRCMEYRDGWGFYAWHGVRVPEQVILAPESLTRDDFLSERNVEVRRVIQERMGSRFVRELGGQVIDSSPYGTLYEVRLPQDDPERVAHYVQVQDASTARQYFLRVPPTIQTAAEAVAWTFGLSAEEYDPAQET